jgi:salicylate hydroxylase
MDMRQLPRNCYSNAIIRNGLTGKLVKKNNSSSLPIHYQPHRVRRTRLQSALKSKVPEGIIKLNKRLSSLEDLEGDGVKLHFEDGTETVADLVIGGDGIRSVCQSVFAPRYFN